jgi:hypothetical protein
MAPQYGAQTYSSSQPAAQGAGDNAPAPREDEFQRSSATKRDVLIGGSLLATEFVPHSLGVFFGPVMGGLSVLAGIGELADARKTGQMKEMFNGSAHMIAGGAMILAGMSGHPLAHAMWLAVGLGSLIIKQGVDHPGTIAKDFVTTTASLAKDAVGGLLKIPSFWGKNSNGGGANAVPPPPPNNNAAAAPQQQEQPPQPVAPQQPRNSVRRTFGN